MSCTLRQTRKSIQKFHYATLTASLSKEYLIFRAKNQHRYLNLVTFQDYEKKIGFTTVCVT